MTDLPAGPELDALVATKVLGWRKTIPGELYWTDRKEPVKTLAPVKCEVSKWSPSTRIDHAWEVMEKLGSLQVSKFTNDRWHACRTQDGDWDCCDWYSIADTAPLCICYAALRAVGGE